MVCSEGLETWVPGELGAGGTCEYPWGLGGNLPVNGLGPWRGPEHDYDIFSRDARIVKFARQPDTDHFG